MPPEQAVDSTTIDHRADIYSLGATLYFLLHGKPPYEGQTMMTVLLKHREATIPSLAKGRSEVPAALEAAFQRMLAKAPADRFQNMSEVVHALETVQVGLSGSALLAAAPAGTVVRPESEMVAQQDAATGSAPPLTASTPQGPASPSTQTRTILLVEPSRTQAAIIRKFLQQGSVDNVVTASTGQEALRLARSTPPTAVVSTLILTDMTGIELAKQVRNECKGAPPGFVLISTEAEVKEAGALSSVGAILLHKPFTPVQLGDALALACRQGTPLPSGRERVRVLVVDDSAPARVHMRSVLKGLGVTQLVEVADGAQAVAAVARDTFDLIVTDYNMPLMDGGALVGYLRENPATAGVPIIMVTTETDPLRLERVRRLGVAAICDKSFPAEIVREVLDRL
jgi:two-component system chemotaxis response regulator CheY